MELQLIQKVLPAPCAKVDGVRDEMYPCLHWHQRSQQGCHDGYVGVSDRTKTVACVT